ncbi:TonB-dependent receptor [Wenzhouxiangella limi]|uniref:TonB-dependent receptor n=1 Tax=Wenzhouxiangella limi TaxID=2707351 RepID=A0A845V2Q7_9GAMM|nr:TonB-dependent receptor [Wenzhouxiangella limi]NDY94551.1 TonB-dependent receptor [Wenzhouxiangella limi]
MKKSLLVLSISCALATSWAMADDERDDVLRHSADLETIRVQALPLRRTALESAQPVDVLAGEALDDRRGMTLGETLQNQPGVHSSYYGPGSGRPIIRGLGGPRVRILEDGLSTGDASAPSDDHAVSLDPMLIDQIEILRGPATLLYGSGASGGVVNVIDNRIPERLPGEPIAGRFEVRGDTVADERSGVLRLDGGGGQFAWHLDGTWRDTDDYEIPGAARREFEDHDEQHLDHEHDDDHDLADDGILPNSFVDNRSGTLGASWIGDRGFIGGAFRVFESEYGIPAPHSHGEDEDHDDEHASFDQDHGDEEDEFAFIDLEQRSWNLKAGLDQPLPGVARSTFRLGYNDYTHREIEMEGEYDEDHDGDDDHDHDHEPTVFDVQTWQSRLVLETVPTAGWEGAIGVQFDSEEFVAVGEEAFVAPNETDSLAAFTLQEHRFGDVTLSLGARIERTRVEAELDLHDDDHEDEDHGHDDHDDGPEVDFDTDQRDFTTFSASLGGIWQMSELWHSSLNVAHAQRAPSATELFSNGPHLATFSFEIGDPGLDREQTLSWDLGLHRHATAFDLDVNVFHKQIDDFIYLADTGMEVEGFAVRRAVQQDATFYGLEVAAAWQLHGTTLGDFDLRLGYDLVRGELDAGGDLPRISPQRLSSGIAWHSGPWRAGLEWQRVFRQDRVADFETETPGYNLVNARFGYAFSLGERPYELYLSGRNLGNNEARVHTSFLRDYAPLPGRNFRLGLRGTF